jgi:hypothetical protein
MISATMPRWSAFSCQRESWNVRSQSARASCSSSGSSSSSTVTASHLSTQVTPATQAQVVQSCSSLPSPPPHSHPPAGGRPATHASALTTGVSAQQHSRTRPRGCRRGQRLSGQHTYCSGPGVVQHGCGEPEVVQPGPLLTRNRGKVCRPALGGSPVTAVQLTTWAVQPALAHPPAYTAAARSEGMQLQVVP